LSPDAGNSEDGVNYPRRLKRDVAQVAPADATASSDGRAQAATITPVWEERRQSPRLRGSGSVEFRTEASDVRMWGTLTDIRLHGCYVEMHATFPVGTIVNLVLTSCGIRIQAPGAVRTPYPFLGMGICFAEIEPEQQLQLNELVAALAGHSTVYSGGPSQDYGMKDTLGPADPRAFLVPPEMLAAVGRITSSGTKLLW
jgi:PilZ domain